MDIVKFIKNWTLPISMITGALSYFIYASIPALNGTHALANELIGYIQPMLIFSMLFLTFCKVKPSELRPRKWFLWLALIQCGLFSIGALYLILYPDTTWRVMIEGAMLCMICPTATACAVVTMKLGGSAALITTYTMLINLAVAVLAPALLPLAHPHQGISFLPAFLAIIGKVFPMLICPLIAAWFIRFFCPGLHQFFLKMKDLAFYLWAVALAIAIAVTCKAIMKNDGNLVDILAIAIASLLCCILQFAAGKYIGGKHACRIEGGQALGQKNTVFIIWLGYTFLSPVSSIAGGFYSIWHNLINTYQLNKKRKADEQGGTLAK